jgi:hypothetical protein
MRLLHGDTLPKGQHVLKANARFALHERDSVGTFSGHSAHQTVSDVDHPHVRFSDGDLRRNVASRILLRKTSRTLKYPVIEPAGVPL